MVWVTIPKSVKLTTEKLPGIATDKLRLVVREYVTQGILDRWVSLAARGIVGATKKNELTKVSWLDG